MPRPVVYSDASIIIGLRVKAVERGRRRGVLGPVPVTATWWDLYRDRAIHPPAATVARRFGSWTKACEVAGVPTRELGAVGRPQLWDDEEMLAVVREFLASPRRTDSSFAAYDDWARKRTARPSGAAVLKRFGSWGRAKARALDAA